MSLNPLLLAGSACIGLGWLVPSSIYCTVLGWLGVLLTAVGLQRTNRPRDWFLYGALCHAIGFYWLFGTVRDFSGLPAIAAGGVFLLFILVSSLQFVATFALSRMGGHSPLALTAAWVLVEWFPYRIFPWQIGHTQLAFSPIAQVAELGGTLLISTLMIFTTTSLVAAFTTRNHARALLPILLVLGSGVYGTVRLSQITKAPSESVSVSIVQANLTTIERANVRLFERNTERYVELTRQIPTAASLVVWPEAVLLDPLRVDQRHLSESPTTWALPTGIPMLIGALTRTAAGDYYNSAIGISPSGEISTPYHKRILMPFGEYTPLGDTFPFLREMNASVGDFTAGTTHSILPLTIGARTIAVAPLICYEEVLPGLVRESIEGGAELLIGLSNDAWFGDTAAPHQHHMIAAFRAIENRRSLVRATNSGLSAIIDPAGRTIGTLPVFGEGVLTLSVPLVSERTFYSQYVHDWHWALLAGLSVLLKGFRRRRSIRQS